MRFVNGNLRNCSRHGDIDEFAKSAGYLPQKDTVNNSLEDVLFVDGQHILEIMVILNIS